ncbi:hypothetical protein BO83DRAFT_408395 [Aspergillus eucalypticola CBS 122712]|uniref:Uncharacterized protein n=1 Tax=Aspergillus eucalypticola (strain CBS 122712 / IBT 29274) TaxID=1448314 RepID=A0A317VID6_ASPEC|nr:uncharacterized protein BO83DRAFT_408395 [Aspergillus eucalypticola CBS 122712]PWY72642.1 hypothetical protein BO83DRAFT_408395 [Aspergillus eucalypticola CBS 122712]
MSWFTEPAEKLRLALLSDLQPLERNPYGESTEAPNRSTTGSGPALTLQTSDAESTPGKQHDAGIVSRLADSSTKLRAYYFSDTCRILSAYDSPTNPLRESVARLSTEQPVMNACFLSISASHPSQQQCEMSMLAANHHTGTLSSLAAECSTLDKQSFRLFFKTFFCEGHSDSSANSCFQGQDDPRPRHFFVGALAYWEALMSFVVDNSTDTTDYLLPFRDDVERDVSQLFIYLSRIGSLARQAHHLRRATASPQLTQKDRHELLSQGKHLEELIGQYRFPRQDQFQSTGDQSTPVLHFRFLARSCELSIMLELCRAFPELLRRDQGELDHDTQKQHLSTLAITILTLIAKIPETTGTRASHMPVLVMAGSTLQVQRIEDMNIDMEVSTEGAPGSSRTGGQFDIQFWQLFVDSRLDKLATYIGLDTLRRACRIVRENWAREDRLLLLSSLLHVHWIDVMIDNGLETLIG